MDGQTDRLTKESERSLAGLEEADHIVQRQEAGHSNHWKARSALEGGEVLGQKAGREKHPDLLVPSIVGE